MSWLCKKCGPVKGFIPGNKGEPRCVNDDCDSVLTYERVEPGRKTKKHFTSGAVTPSPATTRKKIPAEERAASTKATREGRAILEAIEARQKARAAGGTAARVVASPPKKREKVVEKKPVESKSEGNMSKTGDDEAAKTTGREGVCGKCGQSKWLLSKNPPLCRSCFGSTAPKGPKKPRKKKGEDLGDALAREVRATEAVARELAGLTPGAVRRVLRFALDHVAEATNTTPRQLLALDAPQQDGPTSQQP